MAQTNTGPQAANALQVHWTRVIGGIIGLVILMIILLIVISGHPDWWQAWVYIAFYIIMLGGSRLALNVKNPDLVRERATSLDRTDIPLTEKLLMLSAAIILPLIQYFICGLDERFGWSPEMPPLVLAGAVVALLVSYLFAIWSMWVNAYYSGVVRIQKERGQTVITTGPYAIMRHPSYSAGLLAFVATSLFLGSLGSLWLFVPYLIVIVWRTSREDRLLLAELDGYAEYAHHVRYRLLPGIW